MDLCIHCDEVALPPIYQAGDSSQSKPFCCQGCLTVYNVLHSKGLESYYEIKNSSRSFKRRSPVSEEAGLFKYLDDVDFLREYSYVDHEGSRTMEFYLEGIHCLACLWLIEKIPEFVDGVFTSKLDLDRSVVTVVLKSNGLFSLVARELQQLGYRPHPLKRNQETADFKRKENRSTLLRIGVAGAAAGNIMIYAVSLYGGAAGEFAQIFNALTVIFAVPVFTYCAYPFYQNAWNALKNRTLSIDIPLSLSLILGAMMGVYNLLLGIPDNYFDSLTALVFLLLLSRYFLQLIQDRGLSASDLHYFHQSESVLKAVGDEFKEIHPRFIQSGDVLRIRAGEFIPADGVVLEGSSNLNNSLLTGESLPVKITKGEKVFSGTQNISFELLMKAEKASDDSRLGRLLKNVENGWVHRSKIVALTNKVSKYFTMAVIGLAVVLFVYLMQSKGLREAIEGAITLMIVTCPCALALAVPLTFTRALSKASQQGIIIKSDEVIEKLAEVKNIFLDKTGTITHGRLKIVDFTIVRKTEVLIHDVIFNLEKGSRHPVAAALLEYVKFSSCTTLAVDELQEHIGKGVSGKIGGIHFEINREGIFQDGVPLATFKVLDTVRVDSKPTLAKLKKAGFSVRILSGDKKEIVQAISEEVGLEKDKGFFNLSPEDKNSLVSSTPHSMMVGDGANDSLALAQAHVGVAVLGAMDISLRAADVYLTTPGLVPVEQLLVLSQETMKIIRRNLIISLVYNSLSVTAAFTGMISPLVAATVMPLSSLSVLISTLYGTKKSRALWKS
jgi:heavy metal-(Cd/Co/Hg/Pb/Zn)-translocating P-type ATPase